MKRPYTVSVMFTSMNQEHARPGTILRSHVWLPFVVIVYSYSYLYSYILQANEQNIKIGIKQTQTQPQYSMPHGRRRVVTPLTRDQK